MKKLLITLLVVSVGAMGARAQEKSGIAVQLGAAANYYYGQGNHNFNSFDDNRVNYQVNGMLGLTILGDKNDHRTMLAGFGTAGLNNRSTIKNIFNDQGYTPILADQSNSNIMYRLEGGLLIGELLRISTGVGQQVFDEQTLVSGDGISLNTTSLQYYSTTVGFNLNVSTVAIVVDVNFNYGKDYNKTVVIPSAGLMFRF
jgi:hypothetical protein